LEIPGGRLPVETTRKVARPVLAAGLRSNVREW
jgi:hypothetical protein